MRVAGLDLAGNPKNPSGLCILDVSGESKTVSTKIVYSDEEILEALKQYIPELTAVDAPLTFDGRNRECDELLREYGALPVTLRGMEVLAKRGSQLAVELKESNLEAIEVYATGSAKILGLYDKKDPVMQKNLLNSGLKGGLENKFLSRDELDAISAALTAYLHQQNQTREVGGVDGVIIVPEV